MALMKFLRGKEDTLSNQPLHDGYIWVTLDKKHMFLDHYDEEGVLVRSQLSAECADKLRYTKDGETVEINPQDIATNLTNGEGLGSIISANLNDDDRPYTEEELPIASGHESWAFGKGCKATEKRAISWGNRNKNSGNTAVVFGQLNENTASTSLVHGGSNYNGGSASIIVGSNLYNENGSSTTVIGNGGASSAIFGAYNYNNGSHSLLSGYLIKNSKPISVKLGRANEDKFTNFFELATGKQLTVSKGSGYNTFTYNDEIYKINYEDEKAVSITYPNGSISKLDSSLRTSLQDGNEVCIGGNIKVPQVFLPYNIFEIDYTGAVIAQGGLHVKKYGSGAELQLKSDGLDVKGKIVSNSYITGTKGTFSDGLSVKKSNTEFNVVDDGVNVKGWIRATNAPEDPLDCVNKQYVDGAIDKSSIDILQLLADGAITNISKLTIDENKQLTACEKDVTGAIYIPNSAVSIGDNVFQDCDSLTSIIIPNSVTVIGDGAFDDCSSLTKVNYTGTIDQWVEIDFYNYFSNPLCYAKNLYINNQLVTDVVLTTATKISEYAFGNCTSLTSITIGDSVTSIGDNAFNSCRSLQSIVIPNTVTTIGNYAFWYCMSLTSITIPNGVTSIGNNAFSGCDSLTSITIPNSVTSIGSSAFSSCDSLTSVVIPDSVTTISYSMFYSCSSLTSITIPDSVTSISDNTFYNCRSLTSIIFKGTVEEWNAISRGFNWNSGTGNYTIYCTDGIIAKE